jgi:hypothetical protein
VDQKVNERQNNRAMVSNKDLFRLGKVENNPYTRFFLFLSPRCARVCVFSFFSWLLLSHVFVHAFIRRLDFIVINGVNLMIKTTSAFQQPNLLTKKNPPNSLYPLTRTFLMFPPKSSSFLSSFIADVNHI